MAFVVQTVFITNDLEINHSICTADQSKIKQNRIQNINNHDLYYLTYCGIIYEPLKISYFL